MTLTVQEISDRLEIMDVLTDYCTAIDSKDMDALNLLFTSDARIDFSKAGGPSADLLTIQKFLRDNLGDLPRLYMITNHRIRIQGDKADVRCLCYNPMELPPEGEAQEVMFWGLWYSDKFIRTPKKGWRIKERVTEPCFHWKIEMNR